MARISTDNSFSGVPAGAIHPYGGTTAPAGYLLCDGAAVSRTTQAALFAAIGTAYGVGDGSTTFNVPDTRGRSPVGKATSGTGSTLGTAFGAFDHAHDAHAVTQPGAHSNHAVTQPAAHVVTQPSAHGSGGGALIVTTAANGTLTNNHSGTAVDAHTATAVDAHSAHTGTAVATHAAANHPSLVTNHIIKT